MKEAAVEILNANAATEKSWASVFADLIKARLTTLVLLTTLVGFYLGWRGEMNFTLMFHVLMGTALVAAGASALNQLLEREYDAKMRRTQGRPLPSGRMLPGIDPDGQRTAQQAVSNTLALLAMSLFPFVFKMAGTIYLVSALVLGAGFLWCAIQFARQLTATRARQLFFASIIYLPLLLALMVWDKLK